MCEFIKIIDNGTINWIIEKNTAYSYLTHEISAGPHYHTGKLGLRLQPLIAKVPTKTLHYEIIHKVVRPFLNCDRK